MSDNNKYAMIAGLGLLATTAGAAEVRSGLDDQTQVAVTIYNQNLALVKDQRKINLGKGIVDLAYTEVSGQIRPETALLRSLGDTAGLATHEQNFDFDLLTPDALLKKYVGREVRIVRTHPTSGEETVEKATVLATNDGVVLKIGNRIETQVPGRIVFDDIPANLRERPTLVMKLENSTAGPQEVELSYLTGGLSWQADYVAELNPDDSQISLNGWVTLTNQSGTSYPNALLQLVAGDVHQVEPAVARAKFGRDVMLAQAAAPQMAEEGLFEYHLYTLGAPTTLGNNQTKQVALLSASEVPVSKEFVLAGQDYYYQNPSASIGQELKVDVYLNLENKERNRLGMPLPKGIMRIYKRDNEQRAQFIGEDAIDHTPRDEAVRLRLGSAFDVTADKTQTDFKKLAGFSRYNYAFESAYKIDIKNAKDAAVTVRVDEPIPGDWEIIEQSQPHEKVEANTARWMVQVPPRGAATLTYRARTRF